MSPSFLTQVQKQEHSPKSGLGPLFGEQFTTLAFITGMLTAHLIFSLILDLERRIGQLLLRQSLMLFAQSQK